MQLIFHVGAFSPCFPTSSHHWKDFSLHCFQKQTLKLPLKAQFWWNRESCWEHFFLTSSERMRHMKSWKRKHFPTLFCFPETVWTRTYSKSSVLSKQLSFLTIPVTLLSTKCHSFPTHPRALLLRSWESGLKFVEVINMSSLLQAPQLSDLSGCPSDTFTPLLSLWAPQPPGIPSFSLWEQQPDYNSQSFSSSKELCLLKLSFGGKEIQWHPGLD